MYKRDGGLGLEDSGSNTVVPVTGLVKAPCLQKLFSVRVTQKIRERQL